MDAAKEISVSAVEVEQALLGACIINPEAIDQVEGLVEADDFVEPLHADLITAMRAYRAEGRRIDIKLLIASMGGSAETKLPGTEITVAQYIARLAAGATTVLNARDFARSVVESANYRRVAAVADMMQRRAVSGHAAGMPGEIAADGIAELDTVLSASSPQGARRVMAGEASQQAFEAMQHRKASGVSHGVTWGLTELNRATLGLHPGQLVILAARPSMGKSTMGLCTAMAAARKGTGVAFFSLEMSAQEIGERALSASSYGMGRSNITYQRIRAGDVDDSAVWALEEAAKRIDALPLVVEQEGALSVSQIAARTRTISTRLERSGKSLGLVVIDHLGLVAPSNRYPGSRHLELGEITAALKSLAKELSIPVLLLCQLSRAVEGRQNKRPQLSDLRESGRIEEDADAVLFLYREAYYLERDKSNDKEAETQRISMLIEKQNVLEISIAKQRQGPTKTIEAFVDMPCNVVKNLGRPIY